MGADEDSDESSEDDVINFLHNIHRNQVERLPLCAMEPFVALSVVLTKTIMGV